MIEEKSVYTSVLQHVDISQKAMCNDSMNVFFCDLDAQILVTFFFSSGISLLVQSSFSILYTTFTEVRIYWDLHS